ncbi:MAG: hypothetical protein ACI8TQ_003193 [Planctomycetota bacterium]|jgi:hypothetical protein
MNLQLLLSASGVFVLSNFVVAQDATPSAMRFASQLMPSAEVEEVLLDAIDFNVVALEDLDREEQGLPPRYAIPNAVSISPFTNGALELVDNDTLVWRMRLTAPEATSINLGFGQYRMPEGGQLLFYSASGGQVIRAFTAADNEDHGELWTPIIQSDQAVVELTIPVELFDDNLLALELTQIGYGYRGFGTKDGGQESGSCNVDVVCPDGDDWRQEIPAIAVISTGGSTFCTGFMVNNTANDRTPYFMTANHCGIGSGNAASLVVFWNYETSTCDGPDDGQLNQFQSGSTFRAGRSTSDFTLVELDDDPNPAWGVTFAGWDRSGAVTSGAIAIHQPSTDEKSISFEYQPTTTTTYLQNAVPGNGTHVRVEDWDLGTTEPGSSGSPLFDPDHRVIGQLHGGFASCSSQTSDWYGKFSVSWDGGTTASTRLSDWLDPIGSGAMTVDTLGAGLAVSALPDVAHDGPVGGPFTFPSTFYTLSNTTASPISYSVSLTNGTAWLIDGGVTPLTGMLAGGGGTLQVEVTLSAAAAALGSGIYSEAIVFDDFSNGLAVTRNHSLEVGRRTIYSVDLSTDPGWTMGGGWEYGVPLGGGGLSNGFPDPTSGATGPNVYGYNLAGDYTNNMVEEHLLTTPFNLTGATEVKLRFKRWLNADQENLDHAFLKASKDNVVFGRIWSNGVQVQDSVWVQEEYDISAISDDEGSIYFRWTMGVTDATNTFSGWNIDDIEISAIVPAEFQNYGAGLAGSGGAVPTLTGTGNTSTGSPFSIDVANGMGGASAFVFVGLNPASDPAFGGFSLVDSAFTVISRTLSGPSGTPGVGSTTLNIAITDPALVGVSLYLQAAMLDAGATQGVSLTEGLHLFADY